MTAQQQLTEALLALLERGQTPPCRRSRHRDYWTSDDREEREYAAASCRMCPLLADCRAAADEAKEKFGVWAGVDRTTTTTTKGKT